MNEKSTNIYHSTFSVELTTDDSIEKTYGFVINEGTETEPKLIHYIHGNVTDERIHRIRMIFNYQNNGHFMERSVSGRTHISEKFTYDSLNNISKGEIPLNVCGEIITTWL